MFYYSVIFLLVAILAGVLGFVVTGTTAVLIAKVLCLVFLVLFVASLVRSRKPKV